MSSNLQVEIRISSAIVHFEIQKYILVNISFREAVFNFSDMEKLHNLLVHDKMSTLGLLPA